MFVLNKDNILQKILCKTCQVLVAAMLNCNKNELVEGLVLFLFCLLKQLGFTYKTVGCEEFFAPSSLWFSTSSSYPGLRVLQVRKYYSGTN